MTLLTPPDAKVARAMILAREFSRRDSVIDDDGTVICTVHKDHVVFFWTALDLATFDGLPPLNGGFFETACSFTFTWRSGRGYYSIAVFEYIVGRDRMLTRYLDFRRQRDRL